MARLPIPGSDDNTWGSILNDFLGQGHNNDGTHKTIPINEGGTGQTSASNAINALAPSQTGQGGKFLTTDGSAVSWGSPATGGDASTNTSSSVDSEIALFSGTGGKTIKRASGTGIATLNAGVLGAITAPTGAVVGTNDTQTITNKRITPRVQTDTSTSTPTPTSDTADIYTITALATAATFSAPTGTPTEGQKLLIRIKDNGTARSISWNAIYRAVGAALPTTTVLSKTVYLGFIYNSTDTKWDLIAISQEA